MALKGSISKEIVTKKILETFENSFQYDKEIRIPMLENGEEIQLKLTLTCAKTNVAKDGENAIPGDESNKIEFGSSLMEQAAAAPTQEEKDNIVRLANILNL